MDIVIQFRLLNIGLVLLAASCAAAQNAAEVFAKAPPEVDEALRARVSKFYQAQVDGKARRAEEIVAEDSKDFFYNMAKPKFLGFEIRDITYSDNFTKAKVSMLMEMYIMMPGFEGKPMKVPGPSLWKIEDGKWCWYITEEILHSTPFGKMTDSGKASPDSVGLTRPTVDSLANLVKVDKQKASLRATASSSDQIKIHNGMQGSVRIELRPHASVLGLEIKADRTEIPAGEDAIVSIKYTRYGGYPPRTVNLDIAVEPLNQLIQCLIEFN